jgi:hypothetical protein
MGEETMFRDRIRFSFIICIILMLANNMNQAQELLQMPIPTHSEDGIPCGRLILEKEFKPDINEDLFFARPRSITVDDENSIYFYDAILKTVLKFSSDYQFEAQFLKSGRGPGEVSGMDPGIDKLYYSQDGHIYICDIHNDKLIQFSKSGKYIDDIKLNMITRRVSLFLPVVDSLGSLYTYSLHGGIIDKLSKKMILQHTYLDKELNRKYVIFKSAEEKAEKSLPIPSTWLEPRSGNVSYDISLDNRLVIYLKRSSTFYVFEGKKQLYKFDILLPSPMESFRNRAIKLIKKRIKKKKHKYPIVDYLYMFGSFFLDRDDSRFFYLQVEEEERQFKVYQFNLQGKLVKIFSSPRKGIYLLTKKNNRFYGLASPDGHPVIFKESKK